MLMQADCARDLDPLHVAQRTYRQVNYCQRNVGFKHRQQEEQWPAVLSFQFHASFAIKFTSSFTSNLLPSEGPRFTVK